MTKELIWDKPYYLLGSDPFIPQIFDGSLQSNVDPAFNAVKISVDGRLHADLSWKEAKQEAKVAIEQRKYILWEIKLGLFAGLLLPLDNQMQFLSLSLSLEHFRDTIWNEFKQHSLGLIVYHGSLDFNQYFPWDEKQLTNWREWLQDIFPSPENFEEETGVSAKEIEHSNLEAFLKHEPVKRLTSIFCRDVCVEYLALLVNRLPDTISCYLQLDASTIKDPLYQAQLLHPERYESLGLIIKEGLFSLSALAWDKPASPFGYLSSLPLSIPSKPSVKIGVCLPPLDSYRPSQYQGLSESLKYLLKENIEFKLIPETHLITDWDGLDYLLYVPNGLSSQGKRKLQGFCAAGGTVVSLGELMGLPYEMSFYEWIKQIKD